MIFYGLIHQLGLTDTVKEQDKVEQSSTEEITAAKEAISNAKTAMRETA